MIVPSQLSQLSHFVTHLSPHHPASQHAAATAVAATRRLFEGNDAQKEKAHAHA